MTRVYKENEEITFAKQKDIMDKIHIHKPIVFDVGANVGQSILQYKKIYPQAFIYSFEANQEMMD